ncbi:MAG: N-acetyltransferase [Comamonas sp.]|jgi:putative acetyltransferase|uniref:GNAT family N-acetyltransferase n=1 Tax=Comamonas sp. TaxID=34028 RepID=UPI002830C981|nr:N-acetyltransferase [Comamonas sp.]MDR0213053.1 N-acetyltransferase [Comamonas sp.]
MNIRPETAQDAQAIEALILAAFHNHPHQDPAKGTTEHLIVQGLRNAGALSLSLVAQDGEDIVGHVAFSPVSLEAASIRPGTWLVMAPVSVAPARQGQGIGSRLIRQGLQQLKARGVEGVVVLGEPAYYTRFGFHHQHRLAVPGIPAEYFMAQRLDGCLPIHLQAKAGFHSAFEV